MTILITGAEGFIGSHLVEALVKQGRSVRCMAWYNSFGKAGWLDTLPIRNDLDIVWGDVRDRDSVKRCMDGCKQVIHLAALIGIPYSYEAPQNYVDTNVTGTLNVLQAARELGIEKVVCTSTSEVYGSAQYTPMDEKHPLNAQSPYAASKISADQLALSFYRSFGLPVAIARPFNVYGPRQSLRAVIPQIITQFLDNRDVVLGNITAERDMTYVTDTVAALIRVLDRDASIGEVINIGSGKSSRVWEIAARINNHIGEPALSVESRAERMRPPESEVNKLLCDSAKAKELLGWAPQVSFDDGLKKTANWFRENRHLYGSGYAV